MIERERIFYFLVGLNPKFDEVSGRVLSKVPFPSISEVLPKFKKKKNTKV